MSSNEQNSSKELPLLTFNSLYNILRQEKTKKQLSELPEEFYEALKKFIENKKNEIQKLKDNKDTTKARKETNILRNIKKITKEILNIRGYKITKIALQNALAKEEILDESKILKKERTIYKSIEQNIQDIEKELL